MNGDVLFYLILFICSILYLIFKFVQTYYKGIEIYHAKISDEQRKIDDAKIECWICPSCQQLNLMGSPIMGNYDCQNCYEIRPSQIQTVVVSVKEYKLQLRIGVERARRRWEEKRKALEPPPTPPFNLNSFLYPDDKDE